VNLPNTQKASLLSPRNSRKIFRFIVLAPSVDRGMNFISALGLKIGENIGTRSAANTPDLFKDLFLTLARVAARGNHCLARGTSHIDLAVAMMRAASLSLLRLTHS
jgi:hypothetical protein